MTYVVRVTHETNSGYIGQINHTTPVAFNIATLYWTMAQVKANIQLFHSKQLACNLRVEDRIVQLN